MALLTGAGGGITFTSFGGVIGRTWSATVSRAVIDTTGFGNWQKNRAHGRLDITGTITGVLDSAATPFTWIGDVNAVVTLNVQGSTTAGNTLAFNAIVDRCDIGVDVSKETSDITYNFSLASTSTSTWFAFTNIATAVWSA